MLLLHLEMQHHRRISARRMHLSVMRVEKMKYSQNMRFGHCSAPDGTLHETSPRDQ